jgi:hypothetical protein
VASSTAISSRLMKPPPRRRLELHKRGQQVLAKGHRRRPDASTNAADAFPDAPATPQILNLADARGTKFQVLAPFGLQAMVALGS